MWYFKDYLQVLYMELNAPGVHIKQININD